MTYRHHNRPDTLPPMLLRMQRAIKRTLRTFDNAAEAAHWAHRTATHMGGK